MSRGRHLLLSLTATLGGLCLAWTLLASVGGLTPLVVLSGSMSPSIETGALAVAREVPASDLAVGDVVSVENQAGARVTHRVTDARPEADGVVALTLKGDANAAQDGETYRVTSADRVWFDVPVAGRVVKAVGSPAGLFGGFVLVGLALWSAAGRKDDEDDDGDDVTPRPRGGRRKADTGRRRGKVLVGAAVVLAAGAVGSQVAPAVPTFAAFSDTATVTTGSFGSHTVEPPASVTCAASGTTTTISWPERNALYDYEVVLKTPNGAVASTKTATGTATSVRFTSAADYGYGLGLSLGANQNFTVEVRSFLARNTDWVSATSTSPSQRVRVNATQVVVTIINSAACVA